MESMVIILLSPLSSHLPISLSPSSSQGRRERKTQEISDTKYFIENMTENKIEHQKKVRKETREEGDKEWRIMRGRKTGKKGDLMKMILATEKKKKMMMIMTA